MFIWRIIQTVKFLSLLLLRADTGFLCSYIPRPHKLWYSGCIPGIQNYTTQYGQSYVTYTLAKRLHNVERRWSNVIFSD